MSTDPFQLYSLLHRSTRSANDIQATPDFSWSLDDITSTTTSPLTPLDSSLWLPDDFSSGARNVAGPPTGLFSRDSGAYTQIQYKCQHLEYDLLKEKEDHNTLKFIAIFSHTSVNAYYSFRVAHQKLIDTHNRLMIMFREGWAKRECEDKSPSLHPSPITGL